MATTGRPSLSVDDEAFAYGSLNLEKVVEEAYERTNQRVLKALKDDFQLLAHLKALESCVLLAQGDFALQLVDGFDAAAQKRRGAFRSSGADAVAGSIGPSGTVTRAGCTRAPCSD